MVQKKHLEQQAHLVKYFLLIYTILIIILAVLPINRGDSFLNNNFILSFRLDYVVHFMVFILWMTVAWLFSHGGNGIPLVKILGWILAGLCLAAGSECLQFFIPFRAFNINDLVANGIGVLLGSVIFLFRKPGRKGEKEIT